MAYKTPGVYVVEKSIFPPSVAQVETAIPAFIGYTEKAIKRSADDLHLKAHKIASLLEYRQYFGGPPPLDISNVSLDGNNALSDAAIEPDYYLYNSLQMFFMNGGGDCYIVTVGKYGDAVSLGDRANPAGSPGLDVGLAVLEKADEPTMLLFPDAIKLSSTSDFYTLQKNALAQCNDLMDRVAILDLREHAAGVFDWEAEKDNFRNNIGTNFLKYGAAYTPHLKTSLQKNIKYKDIRNNSGSTGRFNRSGIPITLDSLTNDSEVQQLIAHLNTTVDDYELINDEMNNSTTVGSLAHSLSTNFLVPNEYVANLRLAFEYLYEFAINNNGSATAYRNLLDSLYNMVIVADGWFYDANDPHTSDPTMDAAPAFSSFQTQARSDIFNEFDAAVISLISFDEGSASAGTSTGATRRYNDHELDLQTASNYGSSANPAIPNPWDHAGPSVAAPSNAATIFSGANQEARRLSSLPHLRKLFEQLIGPFNKMAELAASRMNTLENSLLEQFPTYKNLVAELNQSLSVLPPSGAVAGVYAQVDSNRGVWKAPANISLNGVSDLTYQFSQSETDDLNVDTNFGKSVNAIKYMTGMGHMVWGARTLAGNDNEWRYISVRRFFNMVEESVKKSTVWAVFESNDANTWIKVKGMIENFLTLQWRNGALQGAKPEDAFYVKVGLGETMTSLDILEGRMNVEIGMAVVRPAEFIILTFSHKLAES